MQIAVIGAGSWGSAMAWLLGGKGHDVRLWARNAELVETFNREHHNPRYLPDAVFAPNVVATTNIEQAATGADAIVLATPSAAVRETARKLAGVLSAAMPGASVPLVLLSKGVEVATGELLLDVLADELGAPERLAVLSGPNHAEEVVTQKPAATVVAARDAKIAALFQNAISTNTFRVYTSDDIVGVQLCGAAKNVIAIACGISVGLGNGDNTTALLMTRGLAELSRLVTACGGQQITCMGLAGMGDLIATCTSLHSRNRSFGLALASGISLATYEAERHMVVEGAQACKSVTALALSNGIDLPIADTVLRAVWGHEPPRELEAELISRSLKSEFE